jgi:hypothetical protein
MLTKKTEIVKNRTELICKEGWGFFLGGGVSDPLCLFSSSALHFSNYSFWIYHPVNWDDWHILAHAIASDFAEKSDSAY